MYGWMKCKHKSTEDIYTRISYKCYLLLAKKKRGTTQKSLKNKIYKLHYSHYEILYKNEKSMTIA